MGTDFFQDMSCSPFQILLTTLYYESLKTNAFHFCIKYTVVFLTTINFMVWGVLKNMIKTIYLLSKTHVDAF